jgi:hypothetical protein
MTARRPMLMASVAALTMLGVGAAAPNVTTCEGAIQGNVDDGARPDLLAIGNPKKHFACAFHHNDAGGRKILRSCPPGHVLRGDGHDRELRRCGGRPQSPVA